MQPEFKSRKIYAVIESVLVLPCGEAELDDYLKKHKLKGSVAKHYFDGGVRSVVVKEQIPLTMAMLDKALGQ